MDNQDYIRVLLYSYYTTITGWGVHLLYVSNSLGVKPVIMGVLGGVEVGFSVWRVAAQGLRFRI